MLKVGNIFIPEDSEFISDGMTPHQQQLLFDELTDRQVDILKYYLSDFDTLENKHMEFWNFFRHWAIWYPDLFYEMVAEMNGSNFKFDADQKIVMREMSRRKTTTIINNRRWGKSFLAVAVEVLKCIIIPHRVTAFSVKTKDDGMDILSEKLSELKRFFPFIEEEAGKIRDSQDTVEIQFKNGSKIYATTALKSRGKTITGALIIDEWCFRDLEEIDDSMKGALTGRSNSKTGSHDPIDFNNVHRISSAGLYGSRAHKEYKDAFKSWAKGENEFVCTTSYSHNLLFNNRALNVSILESLKDKMIPMYFDMNYRSIFGGSSDGGSIPIEQLEEARKISKPEISPVKKSNVIYFIAVDFARSDKAAGDRGIAIVGKVHIDNNGLPHKLDIPTIVELPKDMTAEEQILRIKKLDEIFKPVYHVWDANVMGQLFFDEAAKEHTDEAGNVYPALTRLNSEKERDIGTDNYKQIVYGIQTGGNVQTLVLNAFRLKFAQKKVKILKQYKTELNSINSREKFLTEQLSHYLTDLFIDECMNTNIIDKMNGKVSIQYVNSNKDTKDILMTMAYLIYFVFNIYVDEYLEVETDEEDTSAFYGLFHRAQ